MDLINRLKKGQVSFMSATPRQKEIFEEMVGLMVVHLSQYSPEEREKRIQAFFDEINKPRRIKVDVTRGANKEVQDLVGVVQAILDQPTPRRLTGEKLGEILEGEVIWGGSKEGIHYEFMDFKLGPIADRINEFFAGEK